MAIKSFLRGIFQSVVDLDADQARAFMAERPEGTYTLLDVRTPKEYEKKRLPGAELIPLSVLEDHLAELDPEKPVLVY